MSTRLVVYRTTPAASGDGVPLKYDDVFSARWDRATDFGLVGGYDFGWFRVEGELARKRASIDHHAKDDIADQFLSELNAASTARRWPRTRARRGCRR